MAVSTVLDVVLDIVVWGAEGSGGAEFEEGKLYRSMYRLSRGIVRGVTGLERLGQRYRVWSGGVGLLNTVEKLP